ncbi:MAG: FecR family protein [Deltaproteobacteria bacterium]|nr:FecR family protein [Deltaproteobacteria bacterium]
MKNRQEDGGEMLEQLREAGPRATMPPDLAAGVRAAVEQAWVEAVADHRAEGAASRRRTWLAAAALVVALVGGSLLWWTLSPEGATVATIAAIWPDGHAGGYSTGEDLSAGSRLTTGEGQRVVIELESGATLRLDEISELVLQSESQFDLSRGAIYVDSGPGGVKGLEVATPMGVVTNIGTQFEVRLWPGAVRVQVREGEIALAAASGEPYRAVAGTALELRGEALSRNEVDPFGEAWAWLAAVPRPFRLEGQYLRKFLDWVVEETGLEVQFTTPQLASQSEEIITRGTISGLTPLQALDVVLPSSGLSFRIEGKQLIVDQMIRQ